MPTQNDESTDDSSIAESARENAPAADDLLSAEDILLHDSEGDLKVKTVDVERFPRPVETEPILEDEYHSIVDPFLNGRKDTITNEELAALIDAHLVTPDFTDYTSAGGITASFVGENISKEHQLAFVEAMCRAGGYPDAATTLAGKIPDDQQGLILEVMAREDIDIDDLDQGNQTRR